MKVVFVIDTLVTVVVVVAVVAVHKKWHLLLRYTNANIFSMQLLSIDSLSTNIQQKDLRHQYGIAMYPISLKHWKEIVQIYFLLSIFNGKCLYKLQRFTDKAPCLVAWQILEVRQTTSWIGYMTVKSIFTFFSKDMRTDM